MKIQVIKKRFETTPTDAAVLPHFEDQKSLEGPSNQMDKACHGAIQKVLDKGDFTGRLFQTTTLYTDECAAKRVILIGLGKKKDFTLEILRGAYATAARQARTLNIQSFSTSPNIVDSPIQPIGPIAEAIVEGVGLGLYQFTQFKTVSTEKVNRIKNVAIVDHRDDIIKEIKPYVKRGEIIVHTVSFVRDMVSTPANEMTPLDMSRKARTIVSGNVTLKILNASQMKKLGMNALLGVAKGSDEPAKFIILEYRGAKKTDPFIALVGKGLTFDSGGISIKPADKMDEMKSDMAGGAAVVGAIKAASELRLKRNVVGIVPAAENLPGGRAYKPGDILKSMSGKTIEVLSTDAEGRLILADALSYACRYKPAAIIDIATLTGACIIALGDHVIGMIGNDPSLKEKIARSGETTGERVWELPLWDEYKDLIKSGVADLKNTGGRAGGAITAAAFLSNFVDDIPWVHLDIAGPAWLTKDRPYIPKGASGVGVRLLVDFLQNWKN